MPETQVRNRKVEWLTPIAMVEVEGIDAGSVEYSSGAHTWFAKDVNGNILSSFDDLVEGIRRVADVFIAGYL